jgi:hypothetical protein
LVPDKSKPILIFKNYKEIIKDGLSANELLDHGLIKPVKATLAYPLKFSFDESAIYEDLPASEPCEYQGYFYPGDDYAPGMGEIEAI